MDSGRAIRHDGGVNWSRRATLRALSGALVLSLSAMSSVPARAAPQTQTPPSVAPFASLAAGQVDLRQVASGLSAPLGIVNAGDGTDRLFILEKGGSVRVFADGVLQAGTSSIFAAQPAA